MIKLPTSPSSGNQQMMRSLLLIGMPKIGKTHNLMQLKNNLLVDLQDRSGQYDGMAINVPQEVIKQNAILEKDKPRMTNLKMFLQLANQIAKANQQHQRKVYDFITIDTIKEVEAMAKLIGLVRYFQSPGANKDVTDLFELSWGKGYDYLLTAAESLLNRYLALPKSCLILLAHPTLNNYDKDGSTFTSLDIDLNAKKLKRAVCASVDAIGKFYKHPSDPNKNVISFKPSAEDLLLGASPDHLINRQFVISERDPKTGQIKTYWEKLFIELNNTKNA